MIKTAQEKILKPLNAAGYEAFVVGGAVRDTILGSDIHDVDVATNCPIHELEKILKVVKDVSKNMNLGVSLVEANGFFYEVAQFRSDGQYSDHRRPDNVTFVNSFKDDASRRDLTINALAMDDKGNIIDFFRGQEDLKNSRIAVVGCAYDRFNEDFLRILRAIRFAAKYNFEIEQCTAQAIEDFAEAINDLAPERIQGELEKMASLGGQRFSKALWLMREHGLLKHVLPEIDALFGLPQSEVHHPEGCAGTHTLAAVAACENTEPEILFAVLFHDIGKAVTYQHRFKNGEWKHTYYSHDQVSPPLVEAVAKRLRWSNNMKDLVSFCAENHMLFHKFTELKKHKALRLISHKYFNALQIVSYCDDKSRLDRFNPEAWQKTLDYVHNFKSSTCEYVKIVTGDYVLNTCQIEPGPLVGRVISALRNWIADNDVFQADRVEKRAKELARSLR